MSEPAEREVVLAVDIGGTTVKGGVFFGSRQVGQEVTSPTFSASSSSALDAVLTVLSRLEAVARGLGVQPAAIGVGTPGLVDSRRGVVRYAANLQWNNLPLVQLLEDRFALPVTIDHDSRTAARAEMGARATAEHFVFIPIGTGVSAAVVVGGEIVSGAGGLAGELGHIPVVPGGDSCGCGQRGCLEAYASAAGILARYRAAGGCSAQDTAEVAALSGADALAGRIWADAVEALATAVTTVTAMLDPAEVIFGGGVSAAGPVLLTPLRSRVKDMLAWRQPPALSLSVAGPRAGLLGAARLAVDTSTAGVQ